MDLLIYLNQEDTPAVVSSPMSKSPMAFTLAHSSNSCTVTLKWAHITMVSGTWSSLDAEVLQDPIARLQVGRPTLTWHPLLS